MKNWYKSKTLIVNAVAAGLVTLEASTGALQPFLPADFYTLVALGLPIVNAVLRVVTTQGVKL